MEGALFINICQGLMDHRQPSINRFLPETLKYWVGSSGVNFTSRGEGASLAMVDHPSSDSITKKIPHGVVILLHCLASQSLNYVFNLLYLTHWKKSLLLSPLNLEKEGWQKVANLRCNKDNTWSQKFMSVTSNGWVKQASMELGGLWGFRHF